MNGMGTPSFSISSESGIQWTMNNSSSFHLSGCNFTRIKVAYPLAIGLLISAFLAPPCFAQAQAPAPSSVPPAGSLANKEPLPVLLPLPDFSVIWTRLSKDTFPKTYAQALSAAKSQDRQGMEQQLSAIPSRAGQFEWTHTIRALVEVDGIAGTLETARTHSAPGTSLTLSDSAAAALAKAQREFSTALRVRASNSDVLYLKAYAHLLAGQPEEGLKAAKEAVWYGRSDLFSINEMHYLQAVGLAQQARLDEAVKSLELANQGQPSAYASVGLASLALARGDRPGAIRAARAAVSADPDHFHANVQLVRALILKADRLLDRSAIAEADKLSAELLKGLSPEQNRFREALEVRTRALIAAEKPLDAEALLIPVLSSTSTPDPLYQQLAAQVRVERLAVEARQPAKEAS